MIYLIIASIPPLTITPVFAQPLQVSLMELTFWSHVIERMLRSLKLSSPVPNKLSSWLFNLCSYELAEIVSHIFKVTFSSCSIPNEWCTSIVTPVPKLPRASVLAEFRPISVNSITFQNGREIICEAFH